MLLCAALAACGGNKDPEPAATPEPMPAPETTPAPAAPQGGSEPVEIESKVGLSLNKLEFDYNDCIEVTVDLDKLDRESAVAVLVDTSAEHGSESAVHDNYEEYRYLSDFSEIPFFLWTPEKDGLSGVRIYADSDGGEELASITIAIGSAELPQSPAGNRLTVCNMRLLNPPNGG